MNMLNCNGSLLDTSFPVVMGIINLTDDSFYKKSRLNRLDAIIEKVNQMLEEGASVIDIGAASSRPGAKISSPEKEIKKLVPVFKELSVQFPTAIFSIDTYHSKVAAALLDLGVHMINDISAGAIDSELINIVSKSNAAYVLMHMKGTPENMTRKAEYEDLVLDLLRFFSINLRALENKGIKDVIIDPGFGFGKNIAQNFKLIQQLSSFKILDRPVMAGLSRKSLIWKSLDITPDDALNGTTVLNTIALENGANILRVHDVKETVQAIHLYQKTKLA